MLILLVFKYNLAAQEVRVVCGFDLQIKFGRIVSLNGNPLA